MDGLIEQVVVRRQGGPEELKLESLALAPPAEGQVRIRQLAIGVNFLDVYHRSGTYPLPRLPAVIGAEGVGIVEALGPGVDGLQIGQRIAYAGQPGAYAAARNLRAEYAVALPEAVPTEAAAGALLRGITAHMLFAHVRPLRAGDTVLVHAAAGGLGLVLVQWAKAQGARVIGTAGSRAKAELALAHGAERVVLYREEDFVAASREFSGGRGVDIAIDGIGGPTLLRSFDAVRPYGMAASIGQAGGMPAPVDLMQIGAPRAIAFSRPSVMRFMADPALYREGAQATLTRLAAGLQVHIGAEFPLAEAAEAHRALEEGWTAGAVLLRPACF
ncbi:2-haloacrylate reductase [Massilia sp. Bi118]|uniref:quinone oxidoreductase family protein n=1 Tax=Massilia sp. Bi118 TaxID=2822346 RepID=UPI001DC60F8D|nr:quinone oxidoreductase [Massilia sp. Bi118]CAH0207795.1 2-haloacrylate reductase [Massilia sp. Bi118]